MLKINFKNKNLVKLFMVGGGALAVALPIAVVVACGNEGSEAEGASLQAAETTPATSATPTATSPASAAPAPATSPVEVTPTVEATPSSAATTTTRTETEAHAQGFLAELKTTLKVDLSRSVFYRVIWSRGGLNLPAALAPYYTLEYQPGPITLSGDEVDAANSLPTWDFQSPPTSVDIPGWFLTPKVRQLWVRLRALDREAFTSYALNITESTEINQVRLEADAASVFHLEQFRPLPNSTPDEVIWPVVQLKHYAQEFFHPFEYSTQKYATAADALGDFDKAHWSEALPTKFANEPSERSLWVRLRHKGDTSLSAARDLSSVVQSLLSYTYTNDTYANAYEVLLNYVQPRVKAKLDSDASSVNWESSIALPEVYQHSYVLEFTTKSFFEDGYLAFSDPSSNWTKALPTSFPKLKSERFLMARLRSTKGEKSLVVDLSGSSLVRELPETP